MIHVEIPCLDSSRKDLRKHRSIVAAMRRCASDYKLPCIWHVLAFSPRLKSRTIQNLIRIWGHHVHASDSTPRRKMEPRAQNTHKTKKLRNWMRKPTHCISGIWKREPKSSTESSAPRALESEQLMSSLV